MQASQELLEEPKIFSGLSAWFSSSVQESRKKAWISGGGRLADLDETLYVFSEDFEAEDTKQLYKTKAYLSESLTVFHAMYIEDCILAGQAKAVDIGFYVLPPAPVYARLKKTMQSQGGEHSCMYKWEAVNCSVCSSTFHRQKRNTGNNVAPAAVSDDQRPSAVECTRDMNQITGYVDIETLEQPDYNDLEEFVVGSNGAEVFLKGVSNVII